MKYPLLWLIFLSIFCNGHAQINNIKPGNWSDVTIWSTNTLPTATDDVILNFDLVIDVNATCRSLSLNGNNVTVLSGVQFNITGPGLKPKRLIESLIGSRQATVYDFIYDSINRLIYFNFRQEDSSFTPIKVSNVNTWSFDYIGNAPNPVRNITVYESGDTDSTLYFYDASARVIREDRYRGGQVSGRNDYSYPSAGLVLFSEYRRDGNSLGFYGTDSLIFDIENRFVLHKYYTNTNASNGYAIYEYDDKHNAFQELGLFKHMFTLHGDDMGRITWRAPNNYTHFYLTSPSGSDTTVIDISLNYNSFNYPVNGKAVFERSMPPTLETYSLIYEYY